ncbi:ADYC domain-containing protein [Roseococcus sp. YIM B11640]|uniref:ADYC domain-containing protein n=1 Tax=Roseococcus sp. YIM B11640 TaxID=3133973 RepID=UPI003C7C88B9
MRRLLPILLLALSSSLAAAQPRLTSVTAEGGDIRAELSDGRVLRGADLIGAVLHLGGAALRIDSARRDEAVPYAGPGPVRDVWLFGVSARGEGGAWGDFCRPDPQGERLALVYPGEGGALNITCSGGSVGKCIRFGYRPWASLPDGRPLAPYHAACNNLVRAAYGGGEHGWTRDGMLIDIYDHVGIQSPGDDPTTSFEAGWTPQGAVCIAHTRVPENGSVADVAREVPALAGRTGPAGCDEARAAALGALLFNRSVRQ